MPSALNRVLLAELHFSFSWDVSMVRELYGKFFDLAIKWLSALAESHFDEASHSTLRETRCQSDPIARSLL
jgi:hypothetical protein